MSHRRAIPAWSLTLSAHGDPPQTCLNAGLADRRWQMQVFQQTPLLPVSQKHCEVFPAGARRERWSHHEQADGFVSEPVHYDHKKNPTRTPHHQREKADRYTSPFNAFLTGPQNQPLSLLSPPVITYSKVQHVHQYRPRVAGPRHYKHHLRPC